MDNELIAVEQSTAHNSLDLIKNNEVLEQENSQATLVVKQVLHNKPNPVMIKNKKTGKSKRHLEFEDWIALGNAYGITVKTHSEPVEVFEAKGFKGFADVVRVVDGVIIGGAESYCLDNEKNWLNRDYFQMSSMAQTRAGSKALSNALRGVVALDKSLSGTPSEEMENINDDSTSNKPSAPKPAAPKPSKPKVPNSSNLGNKPKAPAPKPKLDDEAIEVEAIEVQKEPKVKETLKEEPKTDTQPRSFKEICDSNKALSLAVKELQANGSTVNHAFVHDKLLDLWDMGKITDEEIAEAKKLLE